MQVKKINKEVLYAVDRFIKVGYKDIKLLKVKSLDNDRKRIRLCTHKDVEDNLHEMFIVHAQGTYVRPHKHLNKAESLHIIEGLIDLIIFDDEGNILEVVRMGDYSSGGEFYHRISDSCYHTMLIRSEFLVFHEVTNGPFKRSDTVFPRWAPDETDSTAIKEFMERLSQSGENFLSNSKKSDDNYVT